MKRLCIYHGGCTDGVAAAWVVWTTYPDCTFFPGEYGEEPPCDLIEEMDEVVFVDFSYKRSIMDRIPVDVDVVVLDHHVSAARELGDAFDGIIDMERCGALLAWEWFRHGEPVPAILREIDKHDRWLPDRDEAIVAALRSYPHEPDDMGWHRFFSQWSRIFHPVSDSGFGLDSLREQGRHIARYKRLRVNDALKRMSLILLNGFTIPVVNVPHHMASDVAGALAESKNGIGAAWWFDGANVQFELRSRSNIDVSKIAESFGGGGHRNAAGFRLTWDDAISIFR